MSDIRLRFAPSPTGFLHVGGARTALFNWLYARQQGGKLILRLEDTDLARSEDRFQDDILDSLSWLGIDCDEGPYRQSERIAIHKAHIQRLLTEDKAYYEGEAVRFRLPREKVIFTDIIRGPIEIDTAVFEDDLVIQKSDGSPTYNFACVVDDATMELTHIIRGEDHITNTPKQILLYRALGYKVPKFAHLPLILGIDRSRLSKRSGAVAVTEYRNAGFLPEALINYLALLGWSPKDGKEILSADELIKKFSLKAINKTGASFDTEKLEWLNGQYIRKTPSAELKPPLRERLAAAGHTIASDEWFDAVIELFKVRIRTLDDIVPKTAFLCTDTITYDDEAVEEYLKKPGVHAIVQSLIQRFEALTDFDEQAAEETVKAVCRDYELFLKDVIHPLRVAVTGSTESPGMYEVLALLGKEKVLIRLRYTADTLCR